MMSEPEMLLMMSSTVEDVEDQDQDDRQIVIETEGAHHIETETLDDIETP